MLALNLTTTSICLSTLETYQMFIYIVYQWLLGAQLTNTVDDPVTPSFKDKTECITICMPGSNFIHIETL